MNTIHVLIALEDPLLRERLHTALSVVENLAIVGETDNGNSTLEALKRLVPDVVIVGCRFPDMPGTEVVAAVRERQLSSRAIAFSAQAENCIQAMVSAGVTSYIVDGGNLELVPSAVEAAVAAEPHFNLWGADSSALLGSNVETLAQEQQQVQLTERQTQIAYMVGQGKTNGQIAHALHFSKSTIEAEVRRIRQATGATSRIELASWARRNISKPGSSPQH